MHGQVKLHWSSHQATVISMLDSLLEAESLVDVTLACEGQMLQAHRIILSACSPYFQLLLSSKERTDPIIFLKGVKFTELKALVNFIYRGEVNITQDDLPSFLHLAQELQIRGLATQGNSNVPVRHFRSKILEAGNKIVAAAAKAAIPSPNVSTTQQSSSVSSSPPPLKKARQTIPSVDASHQFENSTCTLKQETLEDSANDSLPEVTQFVQVVQSEEFDDDVVETNDAYKAEEKGNTEAGIKDNEGFAQKDWRDVLAEDDDSVGEFSFSDPDGWRLTENEGLEMIPDDDDEVQEIGGSGQLGQGSDEPSSCSLCNKVFLKRKTWNTHCLYDCPMVAPKYSCLHCEYKARRGYQLKIHCLKIHGIVT